MSELVKVRATDRAKDFRATVLAGVYNLTNQQAEDLKYGSGEIEVDADTAKKLVHNEVVSLVVPVETAKEA